MTGDDGAGRETDGTDASETTDATDGRGTAGTVGATDATGVADTAAVVVADDVALAPFAGIPLVDHVAARLVPVVDEVVVVCRPSAAEAVREAVPDARVAVDDRDPGSDADPGGLSAIEAGLAATDADRVAVVAGDLPFVDPTFVDALFGFLGTADAAVPDRDGEPRVTLAAYRRRPALAMARAGLAAGDPATTLVDRLSTRVVTAAETAALTDAETFHAVDTPAAFDAAERRFEPAGGTDRPLGDRSN